MEFVTPVVTMTTSCRVVPTRRRELPSTKHPREYVSLVARVTNASFLSTKQATKSLLTHYQTTNFRLFQTEKVCRRQFDIRRK